MSPPPHRHVPGLHVGEHAGDVGRDQGGDLPPPVTSASDESWFNLSPGDDSIENHPAAWPPGPWELHNMAVNDNEPNATSAADGRPSDSSRSGLGSSGNQKSSQSHRKIPSTYPPSFSANGDESYTHWKRAVQCWIAGEGRQLPEDVMGPRCLSVLKGRASVIVRHLKIEEVSKPGGLALVFKALEASPLVKELDGQRGEKAQREFLRCRRQSGESMSPSS